MNANQPITTQSYGYDGAHASFQVTGTPFFDYDACANWFGAINFEVLSGNAANLQKFTGKERDAESGLDYFGARYYGSALGRWTSPDAVNLTDERLINPANTLNKYVYGANNPLKYIDPDGKDITVFYEQGNPTGHVMLSAYNQQSGDFAFLSVGPQQHFDPGIPLHPFEGVPGNSEFSLPSNVDDLRRNFTAVTIQTDPEVAQQAIDAIRNGAGTGNWALLGNNCTTACVKLLKEIGLSPGSNMGMPWTPDRFWQNIQAKYGKSANFFSRSLANTTGFGGLIYVPRNGQDSGNPRYGMDTFDRVMLMLKAPLHGCVSYGADGHDKTCD
jgi:RHS repeat-associated protein